MAEGVAAGSIGDLLLKNGLVTQEDLAEANRRRREEDKTLGRVLVEMGALDEERKLSLFKEHFGYEVVALEDFEIDPRVLALLPRSFCERHMAAPILRERNTVVLAVEDPSDVLVIDEARDLIGVEIQPVIASCRDILGALQQYPLKDEEGRVIGLAPEQAPLARRIIYYAVNFLVCFFPIPVFFLMLSKWEALQAFYLQQLTEYEQILFTLLCWCLWIVTVYEINGLIFGASRKRY